MVSFDDHSNAITHKTGPTNSKDDHLSTNQQNELIIDQTSEEQEEEDDKYYSIEESKRDSFSSS